MDLSVHKLDETVKMVKGAIEDVSRDVQLMDLSVHELDETVRIEQAVREDKNKEMIKEELKSVKEEILKAVAEGQQDMKKMLKVRENCQYTFFSIIMMSHAQPTTYCESDILCMLLLFDPRLFFQLHRRSPSSVLRSQVLTWNRATSSLRRWKRNTKR